MRINYELPDDLHRRLKAEAAENGLTLKALIIEALTFGVQSVQIRRQNETVNERMAQYRAPPL